MKRAIVLVLTSIRWMPICVADETYPLTQTKERITSDAPKTINDIDEQSGPPDPSLKEVDSDIAKMMRKQLFERYFPKNWSWW